MGEKDDMGRERDARKDTKEGIMRFLGGHSLLLLPSLFNSNEFKTHSFFLCRHPLSACETILESSNQAFDRSVECF